MLYVPPADEPIVLESFSLIERLKLQKKGAVVKQQKFLGHIEQKNSALAFASNNYILSLDADEALDEQLINSISQVKINFSAKAYNFNR